MTHIRSVLFDRDGTVIEDKQYLSDPAGVELLPGAAEGLGMLAWAGARLFLVTNQSGIGRGYFAEDAYRACAAELDRQLAERGIRFEGAACCPHRPEENCPCRKPGLGMWRTLRDGHGLRAEASAMVGDKAEDVAFGLAAGFPAVALVLTGKGAAAARSLGLPPLPEGEPFLAVADRKEGWPHVVARDLHGVALWLLDQTPCAESGAREQRRRAGDFFDALRTDGPC